MAIPGLGADAGWTMQSSKVYVGVPPKWFQVTVIRIWYCKHIYGCPPRPWHAERRANLRREREPAELPAQLRQL